MPPFQILHIARFPVNIEGRTSADGRQAIGTEVVFSPLRHAISRDPITTYNEDPEHALAWAKRRYPHLIHSLAVEPVFVPEDYLCQSR